MKVEIYFKGIKLNECTTSTFTNELDLKTINKAYKLLNIFNTKNITKESEYKEIKK